MGTNRIYEEPSRLSQVLVVVLSIAVVLMASWLAVTITLSKTAPTLEDAATASDEAASLPTTLRQPVSSNAVHFDWPAEFASSIRTPAAAPPAQTTMPPAPEVPPARELGRGPWPPAAPDARDRSQQPSRHGAGAATEATDAIVDLLTPPVPPRTAAAAPSPRQAQAQRRQKPRVGETESAAQ
jgi:hypothetical protein